MVFFVTELRTFLDWLQTELGSLAGYNGEHHVSHTQLQEPGNYAGIESGLTFLGLAGLMDPPRPEASFVLHDCCQLPAMPRG